MSERSAVMSRGFRFSRNPVDRGSLFVFSILLGPVFGIVSYGIIFGAIAPATLWDWVFVLVVSELAFSGTLFCVAGLIWSLFVPNWLERLLQRFMRNLVLSLGLFVLISLPYAVWALMHA